MTFTLLTHLSSLQILLSITLYLPLLLVALLLITRNQPNTRDAISLVITIVSFCLNCLLYIKLLQGESLYIHLIRISKDIYIGFYLEKISVVFALLVNFLWAITTLYAIGYLRAEKDKHQTRFFIFLHLSIMATFGIAYSSNVLSIFFFYELLTLATLPLVGHKLNKENIHSFNTYAGVLVSTSLLFFVPAILILYLLFGTSDFVLNGLFVNKPIAYPVIIFGLLLLFIFGISKTGIMPFHKWLPSAMIAPTPVSALLHAVAVVNSGAFILLKIMVFIFGITFLKGLALIFLPINLIYWIPCITILWASIIALFQDNLKARLAYSTIAQLSYIVLAILLFSDTSTLASIVYIIAHSFAKITLFFAAGALIALAHKHNVSELGGVGKQMPIVMVTFSIGVLSIIGLPLTVGFTGKWFVIRSIIESKHLIILLVMIISTILNALYLMPVVFNAFFGKSKDEHQHHYKTSMPINIALCITALCVILLFIYSNTLIQLLIN
ncbi:Na(+)/H(+) antiporter subunit A [Candidatus Hepatincola sp. Pdp]